MQNYVIDVTQCNFRHFILDFKLVLHQTSVIMLIYVYCIIMLFVMLLCLLIIKYASLSYGKAISLSQISIDSFRECNIHPLVWEGLSRSGVCGIGCLNPCAIV